MSDPKYNKYAGTVRFDDDNIVDIDLQPDTENIRVLLNGEEVTGGSDLPEVDSGDNGKVLTVVSGEWAAAQPATPPAELPAVTSSDNGDVLTVVSGEWAKAAPAGGSSNVMVITITVDKTTTPYTVSFDKTAAQVNAHIAADDNNIIRFKYVSSNDESIYYDVLYSYDNDGTAWLNLFSVAAYENSMTVYMGAVNIGSDTIAWDDTLDDTTTGVYPGGSREVTYSVG